jgi:hypothetical protein
MTLNRDSYMKTAIIHVNGGLMGTNVRYYPGKQYISSTQTKDNRSANVYGYKFCCFIPLIVGYILPAYRHGIFINHASRDGIKSRFPPLFLLKSRIPLQF